MQRARSVHAIAVFDPKVFCPVGETHIKNIAHCIVYSECLVDCELGEWFEWTECSATCGGGTRTRERDVVREPRNGGAACEDQKQEENCNTDPCGGNSKLHLL